MAEINEKEVKCTCGCEEGNCTCSEDCNCGCNEECKCNENCECTCQKDNEEE